MENPIRIDDFGVIALILGNLRLNDVSNEKQWLRNMNLSFLSIEIRLSATNMRVSQTSRSDQRSSDSEESEVGIHRKGGWAVASIHPTTSSLYSWFMSRCLEVQFQLYVYIYIWGEGGGSPEANCILFVWIWKMLILHCVLQCFMLFSESVRSAKVSMSARINLTFVRAEKW